MTDLKLGRSGPSPHDAQRLTLAIDTVAATIPTPPASTAKSRTSVLSALTWTMMGNDTLGDCTVASAGHTIVADTTIEDRPFVPTDEAVSAEYLKLGNGQDNGLTLLDVLKPWQKTGLFGHKLAAYAEIPWAEPALSVVETRKLLKASVYLGGSAYLAFNLPAALQQTPYDWTHIGSGTDWRPGTWGGHAVPAIYYTGSTYYVVSWGKIVPVSEAFLRAYCDEAWMPVSQDWLSAKGATPNGKTLVELERLAKLIAAG